MPETSDALGRFRFAPGDAVRVRVQPPEKHYRTPAYLRGRPGVVTEQAGIYRDPSLMAFHKPGLPMRPLYRVRFRHSDVFEAPEGPDTVDADIYEHWLEPAQQEAP